MRVLVSDTSVLIDLERGGLVEATFQLDWEFAVPDLLYKRELRDFNGPALKNLGLRVEALNGDEVMTAIDYRAFDGLRLVLEVRRAERMMRQCRDRASKWL